MDILKNPAMAGVIAISSIFGPAHDATANACTPELDPQNKPTGLTLCQSSLPKPNGCEKIESYVKGGEPVTSYKCTTSPAFFGS